MTGVRLTARTLRRRLKSSARKGFTGEYKPVETRGVDYERLSSETGERVFIYGLHDPRQPSIVMR